MRFRLFPFLCILVIAYFTYHSIWGNRGFFKLLEILEQIDAAQTVLEETTKERQNLQYKTNALKNPKAIDFDILEEEALTDKGEEATVSKLICGTPTGSVALFKFTKPWP